mgnify:CR=1 FL=1
MSAYVIVSQVSDGVRGKVEGRKEGRTEVCGVGTL